MIMKQNNKKSEIKQVIITNKGFSNLIFNQQKRGISALSLPNSPKKIVTANRQHNIMLLRKNKKQNYYQDNSCEQGHQLDNGHYSPQYKQVNVINLMNCSMETTPKTKSHYCKKITLTNVDKYYQFCLKKMKSMCIPNGKEMQKPVQRPQSTRRHRPETPHRQQLGMYSEQLNKSKSYEYTPIKSNLLQRQNQHRYQEPVQNKTKIQGLVQDLKYLQNSYSYICPKHHVAQDTRKIHSSAVSRENKGILNRRYTQSRQHQRSCSQSVPAKKNQFAIDPWQNNQNNQNIVDDAF